MNAGVIKQIRKKSGLTLEEAAWKVGVSVSTFHRWESGKAEPRPRNDARIRIRLANGNGRAK